MNLKMTALPVHMNRMVKRGLGRSHLLICLVLFMALAFCGCGQKKIVYKPLTLQKPPQVASAPETAPAGDKIAAKPSYEILQSPHYEKPTPKVPAAPVPEKKAPAAFDYSRIGTVKGTVVLNAESMPLSDFVVYALGETMKVTFFMDEKVMSNKQPVTLRMPQPTAADKALEMIVILLEKSGLHLEEKAGALYIMSMPPKPPPPTEPYRVQYGRNVSESPGDIIQIVPLKYIHAAQVQQFLLDVSRAKVQYRNYPPGGNVLVMQGQAAEIKKLIDVLETFDVPYFESKKFLLLNFTYIRPEEFISGLGTIFAGLGIPMASSPGGIGPYMVNIKQLNAILLISPDEKTTKFILEWKDKLDNAGAAGTEERAFIYKPQFSKATELVKSIQNLYGTLPASTVAVSSTAAVTAPKTTATTAGGSLLGGKIAADDVKNVIIVVSTPAVYRVIIDLIRGLDTPTRQVLIEATIVELTLTDELKYGVEWYLKNSQSDGDYSIGTFGSLGLSAMGLSYSYLAKTGGIKALVSAWAKMDKANILSTPRLMVMDNASATIQVGEDVPTVTGEYTPTQTGQGVMRNITYRNTGIMLTVKPTINSEGLLTMDIAQEVSVPGAAGAGGSPIILTRRINTTVNVRHGQTIALGGLIKDNSGVYEGKVPILGDIPLIGNLFKYTSKTGEKTELLVLVTPTILSDKDDPQNITNELRKELKWFDMPPRKLPAELLRSKAE